MPALARPRFYSLMGIVLAVLVFIGFTRTYYLKPLFDTPPLSARAQVHGLLYTAWMVVLFAQAKLVGAGQVLWHRRLGSGAVVLAVLMVITGLHAAIGAAQPGSGAPFGFTAREFLIAPVTSLLVFAALVALAVAWRRRAEAHKRLMVLATISIVGPAIGRASRWVFGLPSLMTIHVVTAALVAACVVWDLVTTRRVHPVTLVAGAVVAVSWPLRMAIAKSEAWLAIADRLIAWG